MPGRDAIGSTSILSAADLPAVLDPDLPHELWRGVLRVVMPASGAHGAAVSRLTVTLGQHVYAHDLGELFSESTGFLVERDPDTLLCPDVAFVAKGRLAAGGLGWSFSEIAPDLAVEVLSPGDRPAEVSAKVAGDPLGPRERRRQTLRDPLPARRPLRFDTMAVGVPAPGDTCPDNVLVSDLSSACRP
jgi:hypothetical protein